MSFIEIAILLTSLIVVVRSLLFWEASQAIDGDTIIFIPPILSFKTKPVRVRIHGFDANELSQDGGEWAKQWVERNIIGGYWSLSQKGKSFDRAVASIRTPFLHIDIVEWMLRRGVGVADQRYLKGRKAFAYAKAQRFAMALGLGRWSSRKTRVLPRNHRNQSRQQAR